MRKRLVDRLPLDPGTRARLDRRWDEFPRPRELDDLERYRAGRELYRRLWDGGYTMLSSRRARTLHRLASVVEHRGVPGALVDCGVWNGGSSILLAAGAPTRVVWCFDSFEGLPEPGPLDGSDSRAYAGECRGAEAKLREGFATITPASAYQVRRGWFEDTLAPAAETIERVAVLHCDGDWYESVKLTLETFGPRVSIGGYIVIDDYGTWPGARRATDEFRSTTRERASLRRIDHTGRYWQRLG